MPTQGVVVHQVKRNTRCRTGYNPSLWIKYAGDVDESIFQLPLVKTGHMSLGFALQFSHMFKLIARITDCGKLDIWWLLFMVGPIIFMLKGLPGWGVRVAEQQGVNSTRCWTSWCLRRKIVQVTPRVDGHRQFSEQPRN